MSFFANRCGLYGNTAGRHVLLPRVLLLPFSFLVDMLGNLTKITSETKGNSPFDQSSFLFAQTGVVKKYKDLVKHCRVCFLSSATVQMGRRPLFA